jgi:hypothetical protein
MPVIEVFDIEVSGIAYIGSQLADPSTMHTDAGYLMHGDHDDPQPNQAVFRKKTIREFGNLDEMDDLCNYILIKKDEASQMEAPISVLRVAPSGVYAYKTTVGADNTLKKHTNRIYGSAEIYGMIREMGMPVPWFTMEATNETSEAELQR